MLLASSGVSGASSKTYADDCFGVQLRTGNGTSQSVTTGFQPDLIWTKSRSADTGHRLVDSARGAGNSLESNSTLAQQSEATGITAFNSSGYSVGADSDYNTSAAAYVDWVWKKAPKFLDVQTIGHTNGSATNISLTDLGTVGTVIAKITSTTGDWITWHRSLTAGNNLRLNTTAAQTTTAAWLSVSGSTATLSASAPTGTYVVYGLAHDPEV